MSTNGRRAWTGTERVLVRDNYISKGRKWCAEQLNRTPGAVTAFAVKEGFTRPAKDIVQPSSPLMDARIKRAYEDGPGAVVRLAKHSGYSAQWIRSRAQELGLHMRPPRSLPYTREEAEFVEAHAHLSRQRIAKLMRQRGWSRTPVSVQRFITQRGLTDNGDFLSPLGLSLCLGVSTNAIRAWTKSGELLAHFRDGKDESGAWRTYALADVARFVVAHPHRIDMRKVDGPWLIDLLARYGSLGLIDERDQWRRILALHELGKSNTEIATILETKPNIVASTLSQRRSKSDQHEKAA